MRIALVSTYPMGKWYPVALMKISTYLKSDGHECSLFVDDLPAISEYDEIWLSTLFTFDIPHALAMTAAARHRAETVRVGGVSASLLPERFQATGADVHIGLLDGAEISAVDFSLLPEVPAYSITHTSRGCIRRCEYCMVPVIEGRLKDRPGWERDIHPQSQGILFYDNNWLAKGLQAVSADVEMIEHLVATTAVTHVDFNAGLDARLLTDDLSDRIATVPIRPMRFAFDGPQEDGPLQSAVKKMADRGVREFAIYALYNHIDTPQEFYGRLLECVTLAEETGANVSVFPMRFQPIMDYDVGRDYIGKHWTARQKKGFMNILNHQSISGQISWNRISDFQWWFGRDADTFARMISWPGISTYMNRKKGAWRYVRDGLRADIDHREGG